jgi:glycosyltransferase involved in cell wall biosynthesis
MISFIVPAHNEQAGLGRTLQAIHESARNTGQPYEIIVVDDASTDATAEIARQNDARVVRVNHRQIAATRNSGARAANGEKLFFVDADTTSNARAVAAAVKYMDEGAAGGGAPAWLGKGEAVPLYIRLISLLGVAGAKLAGFTGGAFMFCTREAFQATGGFNERLYWAEEGEFAVKLKREGRFAVLWQPVLTSGRRFRTMTGLQVLALLVRVVLSPFKMFTHRASVEKVWYDSNRANDDRMPDSFAAKISNGITLLIVIVLLTGPVWYFIPWSWTPRGTPPGIMRLVIGTFLCHVGLIFWSLALVIFWSLLRHFSIRKMFRQKHWSEWLKLVLLLAFCLWQAWDSTQGVIWFWTWLGHQLAHFYNA